MNGLSRDLNDDKIHLTMGTAFIDYIRNEEEKAAPFDGIFGFSREGKYVDRCFLDFERIDFRTGESRWVNIFVPETESGIKPMDPGDQPYGWDGKINEYSAEMAVWWAFEIMTPDESRDFMTLHKPRVRFEYVQNFSTHEFTVKFNGEKWVVE